MYVKEFPDSPMRSRVIVTVHGAGKKPSGWTLRLGLPSQWGPAVDLVEANFNQEASPLASYTNFAYRTGSWIAAVRDHLAARG